MFPIPFSGCFCAASAGGESEPSRTPLDITTEGSQERSWKRAPSTTTRRNPGANRSPRYLNTTPHSISSSWNVFTETAPILSCGILTPLRCFFRLFWAARNQTSIFKNFFKYTPHFKCRKKARLSRALQTVLFQRLQAPKIYQ